MEKVEMIFELLDDWRHLPTYQLERRADIFFSLYLSEILQAYTGEEIHEFLIPEFPLHKKALDSGVASNRHYCADYLAFSRDMKRAFLVELKSEADSSSKKQNECLRQARLDEKTFDCWVSFKQVLEVVEKHPDPISQRFARSLTEWSKNAAGSRVNPWSPSSDRSVMGG